jgi:Tol biopolymer transport system component
MVVPLAFASLVGFRLYEIRGEEERYAAAVAADPTLKRPLVSTTGRLAFIVQRSVVENVHTVDVSGSDPQQMTQLTDGIIGRAAAWSPDGRRLAFATDTMVRVVDADTGAAIASYPNMHAPVWSPDGRRLAFAANDASAGWGLYVADGSQPREISRQWSAPDPGVTHDIAWSRDGERIAFVRTKRASHASPANIYVAKADGSSITAVTYYPDRHGWSIAHLAWSPDGQRFAFNARGLVVTINVDGTDQSEFGPVTQYSLRAPQWSTDSKRLLWWNDRGIVVSGPRGEDPVELTRGRVAGEHAVWSADGERIAFVDHYAPNLYVMNADGSGLTLVAQTRPTLMYPTWRPTANGDP